MVHLNDCLALRSGLLEITYDTGAKVVLQGPVTYKVDSAAGGYLAVGKMTACLESSLPSPAGTDLKGWSGRGAGGEGGPNSLVAASSRPSNHQSEILNHKSFTITTPTAIVTDLGTEFGVEVNKDGRTVSRVFRGLVRVQSVADDGRQQDASVELRENESAIVERQNGVEKPTVRRVMSGAPSFVRAADVPKMAATERSEPFRRWLAYSQELRRDKSLLAYYDFQQRRGEPGVLPNVADNGDRSLDGTVQQAAWTNGRMPGKHALLFRNEADCVQINLPRTVDDLTLAAWVNIVSLHHESYEGRPMFNGILLSDGWSRPGQVHWQIDSNGRVCFGRFGVKHLGAEGCVWESSPVFDQSRLRCWMQLAAVYDRTSRVRFYVNGQSVGEVATKYQERIPLCIGPARIGLWCTDPRTFNGRIDELAIFGRLLTSDEIKHMFEAGSPNAGHEL